MAEYEIVNNKSNDFSTQSLQLISRQNFLKHFFVGGRLPVLELTDCLAIVIILWHEKYWEAFSLGSQDGSRGCFI